jgi:DNA modification methylase
MTEKKEIKITAAKGRPMLSWVGKRPLRYVTAFPAQHVETFDPMGKTSEVFKTSEVWNDWPAAYPKGGLLFHGDNKEVLAHLLANGFRGKVKLIYIDPPFDSGADYVRKVQLRGGAGTAKIEGENYTLGEQIQYTDIWANDNYLQFMFERFMLLKEILADDGSIFVHCDNRKIHHLRCILEEVFGPENFVNEIVWQHQIMGGSHDKRFPKAHETIFWYSKSKDYRLRSESTNVRVPFSDYVLNTMKQDENGEWYYERRRMSRKATDEEAASKAHTKTYVENPDAGTVATDIWNDMLSYQELPNEREGIELYPTQKTTKLLTRIIDAASCPGDLVMDCLCGSGVVMKVSQKLGRRWISCDINKGAIQTTAKRLQSIIHDQIKETHDVPPNLPGVESVDSLQKPAQLSYTAWRVNDYDLKIQRNEAVKLACEHIGIERLPADGYFDGKLGPKLVKIVPFEHPLSARTWIDDWNRLLKGEHTVNKIEFIELRTDAKYGKFIKHEPATAKVAISRNKEEIVIKIEDFISPTILKRLDLDITIFKARITDWRSQVDCVMIGTAYDGNVFNVVLSDVPEKKNDLINGAYKLPAPKSKTTVAVKIIDMLGEEVLAMAKI